MNIHNLTFDSESKRHYDVDGRLHVRKSNISKAQVSPYYGREIPDFDKLGLQSDKIYHLLRDPQELAAACDTAKNMQFLIKHIPVTIDDIQPDSIIGCVGTHVKFEGEYLTADLCVWDKRAIEQIEAGTMIELSCGYRYTPDMTAGVFDGTPYDGVMRDIHFNHLALVEVGRAGSDVMVSDQSPFKKRKFAMKTTKLGIAMLSGLRMASPKLALDSALPELVAMTKAGYNRKALEKKLFAMDAEKKEEIKKAMDYADEMEEMGEDESEEMKKDEESEEEKMEDEVKAEDEESEEETTSKEAKGATSEFKKEMKGKDSKMAVSYMEGKMKGAQDAFEKKLREELRQEAEAKELVAPIVGKVNLTKAEEIYKFALDHMSIEHKGITEVAALAQLVKLGSIKSQPKHTAKFAADSASDIATRFPNVARLIN